MPKPILRNLALAEALRNEALEIATDERAELVRRAAQDIEALVEENKELLQTLEAVWQHPNLLPSICGTTDGQPLINQIRRIVGG